MKMGKAIFIIEESAHKSDVVYGYAEVKYKQIIPLQPHGACSMDRPSEVPKSIDHPDDLTPDGIVTVTEEAIVLYIKSLGLLSKSLNVAAAWWAKKHQNDAYDDLTASRRRSLSPSSSKTIARVETVVQWVRSRFNECMDKVDYLKAKHAASRKKLPDWHPHHPSKDPTPPKLLNQQRPQYAAGVDGNGSGVSSGGTSSHQNWFFGTGITAEKLLRDRSIEMSRDAAVHELVGENLDRCEINYVTAIRMLEACIEPDDVNAFDGLNDEATPKQALVIHNSSRQRPSMGSRKSSTATAGDGKTYKNVDGATVTEEYKKDIEALMDGIRGRLASLRRKVADRKLKEHTLRQLQHDAGGRRSPQAGALPMARLPSR